MGGTGQRHFDGTNSKPRKLPENVHAVPTGSSPTTRASTYVVGERVHIIPVLVRDAVLGSLKSYFLEDSFSRYTTQCQL